MSEQEQIEEILMEASAHGLRNEVKELAKSRIGFWNRDKVYIYNWAYRSLINEG